MKQDEDHLMLLTIFHYVLGGLTALFACFPIIHLVIGLVIIIAPESFDGSSEPPPALIGWLFVIFAGVFILMGWILASLIIAAGRCLSRRRRYMFCMVVAGIECIFMPFGTALGIFSLIVLMRPSVKTLFASDRSVQG